ncbi:hypothetical protein M9458_035583, partial [Cirrhinus mrigala]
SLETHITHVRAVRLQLISHQLYAKAEKCEFHQTSTTFLGYVVSPEGVAMDDRKVQAVLNWPRTTNIKELQRFLEFANFYRRFIRDISSIAAPLTSMTKGGRNHLSWSLAADCAFNLLKERFFTAPIHHHPDPELEFIVEIDASNTGVGAVLSQRHGNSPKLFPRATLIVAPVQWDLMTEIAETQGTDPPPAECPPNRTFVPPPMRNRVIQLVHDIPSSGHPGIHLLTNRFWWPSLRSDTIAFVKNCEICNISKFSKQLPAGLLQPLPIPQRPWSHIAIDFVTDLPLSNGYTTILTVIDRFSKSCRLISLPKLPTTLETAEALCEFVFRFSASKPTT